MNQTTATNNVSTTVIGDTTAFITTVHLVWIGVLALIVLAGILYGARLKHRRTLAERQTVVHAREAGVAPAAGGARSDDIEPAPVAPPAPVIIAPVTAAVSNTDAANGPVGQLKGLGPKVAARLAELGVTSVGQIAALDDDGAQALDAQLGPFRGRLERDRWVEQARFLAAGDRAGFEAVFGKL